MKDVKIFKTDYGVSLTILVRKSPKSGKVLVSVLELPFIMVEDTTLQRCKERVHRFLDAILDDFLQKELRDIKL
jgi:hypothetical protein